MSHGHAEDRAREGKTRPSDIELSQRRGLRVAEGPGGNCPVLTTGGKGGGVSWGNSNASDWSIVGPLDALNSMASSGDPGEGGPIEIKVRQKISIVIVNGRLVPSSRADSWNRSHL